MNNLSTRQQNKNFHKNTPKVSCVECHKEFGTNSFYRHNQKRCEYWKRQNGILPKRKAGGWNKGLTKETSPSLRQTGKTYSERYKNGVYDRTRQTSDKKIQYWNDCRFKFNVYHYPELFDLELLENFCWYHPVNNPGGVSRDHIISISYGWKNGIDPTIISHIANCRLILQTDNAKKYSRSDILLEELKQKIHDFSHESIVGDAPLS